MSTVHTASHPDPKWKQSTNMGAQKHVSKNDQKDFFINFWIKDKLEAF